MSSALTALSEPGRAAAPSQRQTVPAPARDTGSIAVSAGIAQRAPDGSVVFDAHPVDDMPALQRAVEVESMTAESAPAPPSVDQAPPEPASAPAATPAEPTAPTAPAVAGAAPANSQNLDELARRLYDPLAARLKAELRLDRERFGLITDLRRP
jgi:hypothetical protein